MALGNPNGKLINIIYTILNSSLLFEDLKLYFIYVNPSSGASHMLLCINFLSIARIILYS